LLPIKPYPPPTPRPNVKLLTQLVSISVVPLPPGLANNPAPINPSAPILISASSPSLHAPLRK